MILLSLVDFYAPWHYFIIPCWFLCALTLFYYPLLIFMRLDTILLSLVDFYAPWHDFIIPCWFLCALTWFYYLLLIFVHLDTILLSLVDFYAPWHDFIIPCWFLCALTWFYYLLLIFVRLDMILLSLVDFCAPWHDFIIPCWFLCALTWFYYPLLIFMRLDMILLSLVDFYAPWHDFIIPCWFLCRLCVVHCNTVNLLHHLIMHTSGSLSGNNSCMGLLETEDWDLYYIIVTHFCYSSWSTHLLYLLRKCVFIRLLVRLILSFCLHSLICIACEFEALGYAGSIVLRNAGERETRDTAGSFGKWVPAFTNRVFHWKIP